ncbi:MAG: TetR/AcrR family transcriptional regulator [Thermoleophilaceae bacterium]
MQTQPEHRDGRTVRAERTRSALVESLLALLDEGEVRPTAAEIADRAGVSERSVFQHFSDREALLEAVAREQYERVMPTLTPVDASRSLSERIDEFATQRCRMFEQGKGVRRAALLMEPESEVVAGWLTQVRRAGVAEVERVFRRELEHTPADSRDQLRAALVAACAWGCFESLRLHQGLSVARTRGAMRMTLARLLAEG